MKGLLLKDIMVQKRRVIMSVISSICIFVFAALIILSLYYGNMNSIFDGFGLSDNNIVTVFVKAISFIFAAASSYTATMATECFGDDSTADFGKVAASLPIKPEKRVAARYLFYLMHLGIMFILNIILQFAFYVIAKRHYNFDAFIIILAGFSLCMIIILIDMPLIYRYGYKVSNLVNIFMMLVICAAVYLAFSYGFVNGVPAGEVFDIFKLIKNMLAILMPVLLIAGIPLSAVFSVMAVKGGKGSIC